MDTSETKNILISVIVPAYNIEQYLPRCLDSILGQTHQNLEVIVVDDGSQDSTGSVIDAYNKKDARIIPVHQDNRGVSKARIAGIERATGAFIGFVDGDDVTEPDLYELLLKNALEQEADISHCGYKMVFPDGREELFYGTGKRILLERVQGLAELIKGTYIEPTLCNKLYRTELLKSFTDSSLWDPVIKINEDVLMNYILFKKAERSFYEDRTLYAYMRRDDSATSSEVKRYKITDPLKVITIIKEDTEEDKTLRPIVYERYLRALINTSQQKVSPEDAQKAREQLKEEIRNKEHFHAVRSGKLRMMAIGAARLPGCYRAVRKVYDKFTGAGTKFKV